MVRNALGMARDRDLVPPMGKYSTTRTCVYLLLPLYGGAVRAGRVARDWDERRRVRRAPARASPGGALAGAGLVAVLGALTALVVLARRAGRG